MELFYTVLVLLGVSRIAGELAERSGQPALVGELVTGIVIGVLITQTAETFPFFAGLTEQSAFQALVNLGMFFVMLYAGLESEPRELARTSGRA